jgi:signal transduction histidine kinase
MTRSIGLTALLLDFAQARHGSGIAIRRKPSDLAEIARGVLEELEAAHPERTASLVVVQGDARGDWDADRLAQVISSLVANAIQYGGGSAIAVTIQPGPAEVTVEVHNGGDPIPATLLPDLFDPFRCGSFSSQGAAHSVGLGLYISREIVRGHGGRIQVRSSKADGTAFTVQFPRRAPADRRPERWDLEPGSATSVAASMRRQWCGSRESAASRRGGEGVCLPDR